MKYWRVPLDTDTVDITRGIVHILEDRCKGCGTCIDANHWTVKRVEKVRKKMEKLGIRPERLQLEWISAAEVVRFAQVMAEMETLWEGVSAKKVEETLEILRNRKKKSKKSSSPSISRV